MVDLESDFHEHAAPTAVVRGAHLAMCALLVQFTRAVHDAPVVNAKALSIIHCQDDINTEHNIKSIGRAAVAQWTKRLTRNKQTRVRIREAHIFDITLLASRVPPAPLTRAVHARGCLRRACVTTPAFIMVSSYKCSMCSGLNNSNM